MGTRTAHAFAHVRLATEVSREPVPGECTPLCLGHNCHAVGIGDIAIWELLKSKKALALHRALAVTTSYDSSMDCKYGLCLRSLAGS